MAKRFDKLLERASDPTLLEPDWLAIMDVVDTIRSNEVPAKTALQSILKRARNDNPHVAHHALLILEAAVKNCGDKMHKEVASRDCMEELKRLAHETKGDKVKEKILECIQCWSQAFRNKSEYKIIVDTHNLMKLEGFEFPVLREADAMFVGQSAPDWVDSNSCYRCRVTFGLLTRKHHCRACGQIFCDKCSTRYLILPHIGIEREVRVCESCYEKHAAKESDKSGAKATESISSSVGTTITDGPAAGQVSRMDPAIAAARVKAAAEREKEELELALAISQSEAEEKERQRASMFYNMYNGGESNNNNDKKLTKKVSFDDGKQEETKDSAKAPGSEVDNELARYLNRSYWDQRKKEQKHGILRQSPTPSAPPPSENTSSASLNTHNGGSDTPVVALSNGHTAADHSVTTTTLVSANGVKEDEDDIEQFAATLRQQVEIFVNRIRSDQARGRSIVNDSSIQTLFVTLTTLHTQLLQRMTVLDDKRSYHESLQDKLAAIGEARDAVDALREEHERLRQEQLYAEQQRRQIQMMQKLDTMRHKKHEMLETQRQMALARFQQHQMELHLRKQQQMQQQQQPVYTQPNLVQQGQMQYQNVQQPGAYGNYPGQQQYQQPNLSNNGNNPVYNMQSVASALPQSSVGVPQYNVAQPYVAQAHQMQSPSVGQPPQHQQMHVPAVSQQQAQQYASSPSQQYQQPVVSVYGSNTSMPTQQQVYNNTSSSPSMTTNIAPQHQQHMMQQPVYSSHQQQHGQVQYQPAISSTSASSYFPPPQQQQYNNVINQSNVAQPQQNGEPAVGELISFD